MLRAAPLLAAIGIASASFLSPPLARAQLFADESAREEIKKLRADVDANLDAMRNLLRQLGDMRDQFESQRQQISAQQQKLQAFEEQTRELRGQVDEIDHLAKNPPKDKTGSKNAAAVRALKAEIALAQESQESLRAEADARLAEIDELRGDFARVRETIGDINARLPTPNEQDLYDAAFGLHQTGDYAAAILEFERLRRFFPQGRFASNAAYWIANAHLALADFAAAEQTARDLLSTFAQSDRASDGMLILARAIRAQGRGEEARGILENIITQNPTSLAADNARQLLTQ